MRRILSRLSDKSKEFLEEAQEILGKTRFNYEPEVGGVRAVSEGGKSMLFVETTSHEDYFLYALEYFTGIELGPELGEEIILYSTWFRNAYKKHVGVHSPAMRAFSRKTELQGQILMLLRDGVVSCQEIHELVDRAQVTLVQES